VEGPSLHGCILKSSSPILPDPSSSSMLIEAERLQHGTTRLPDLVLRQFLSTPAPAL